jgi:UDP-N-acetyl-2-amino-2-deoxyglucuronate dehydrogenase
MKFVVIGIGGYIAERHLRAIRDNGGEVVAAVDPNDSVGIIDSYFPESHFFTEFEQFDAFVSRNIDSIEFAVICSPNFLHKAHISWGLRKGLNVICEKPLVLDAESLNELDQIESESKGNVYSILQLRHHQEILKIHDEVANSDQISEVELTYITSRGKWYDASWKGDERKSGGVVLNIGIHFFDMLSFLFGEVEHHEVHLRDSRSASGYIKLKRAHVRWFLSVDDSYLPDEIVSIGQRTYRNISVDGNSIEFSGGFTDLHSISYEKVLADAGFGLPVVRPSIELVGEIRSKELSSPETFKHRFLETT